MRIYLDHNATTPVRPEVVEAMTAALREHWGNPSSTRAEVAALLGARPREVTFTSGATEANNAVLQGLLGHGSARHVVSTNVEHPSVEEPLRALESSGVEVTRVAVDASGRVDPEAVALALRDDTALVSVILANNETGVVQDAAKLAEAAHARGIPLHLDATQAVGKIPLDIVSLGADWLSGTAHKLNGPKGAGFLLDRSADGLPPLLHGGPQERRRRGGTENLAGIVGLGMACALAREEIEARVRHVSALRDALWDGLRAAWPDARRNGSAEHVLPNTLNLELPGVAGDVLLEALDGEGIAVSSGAACHSGSIEPSGVLVAMGRTPEQARGSLRLSVGPSNRPEEIEHVVERLPALARRVVAASP
jgi:cysteine desulfurase